MQCAGQGGLRTAEEHCADEATAAEKEADDDKSDEAARSQLAHRCQNSAAERAGRVGESDRYSCGRKRCIIAMLFYHIYLSIYLSTVISISIFIPMLFLLLERPSTHLFHWCTLLNTTTYLILLCT